MYRNKSRIEGSKDGCGSGIEDGSPLGVKLGIDEGPEDGAPLGGSHRPLSNDERWRWMEELL
jgi:hypothetical protein